MRKFAQSFPLHAVSARFALAAALVCAAAPAAFATVDDGQAEWAQRYDADAKLTVERSTTPILSSQTVAATEAAIQQYQDIAARGGWTTVPSNAMLRLGSNSPAVSGIAAAAHRFRRIGAEAEQVRCSIPMSRRRCAPSGASRHQ